MLVLPLVQVQLAVFIYMKGNLDDHNYSDVSLSQVFSVSEHSEFVIVKRKFDFFFISDMSQVKTQNQNNELWYF